MGYLTDHRKTLRNQPENLLSGLKSIICVGLVYNAPEPWSTAFSDSERAWISRYAWGTDYHSLLRRKLEAFAAKLLQWQEFSCRICVDTAPLLERSFARQAGLGWIGRNTCLINQNLGSWLFLGELLTTLELEPDSPPPDRCGTCTQCIDACPTGAIVPSPDGQFELDARLCISYFTIELRSPIPESHRASLGHHVFGCDICQDVCPWNRRAATTRESGFLPREVAPPLERDVPRYPRQPRQVFRLPAQCCDCDGQFGTRQVPRPARKTRRFTQPPGVRTRRLGITDAVRAPRFRTALPPVTRPLAQTPGRETRRR
jgi:epoxyqueuosine reductase